MEVEFQTTIRSASRSTLLATFLLAVHIAHIGFAKMKAVTIFVVFMMIVINASMFLRYPVIDVCASSLYLWHRGEWYRMIYSHFFHISDFHMLYCAVSFTMKASAVEPATGSGMFFFLTVLYIIFISLFTMMFGFLAEIIFDNPSYVSRCVVGMSGLAFALKVPSTVRIHDRFPMARVFCWLEIILVRILVPDVSLIPHLAGVLTGLLFLPIGLKKIQARNEEERAETTDARSKKRGGRR